MNINNHTATTMTSVPKRNYYEFEAEWSKLTDKSAHLLRQRNGRCPTHRTYTILDGQVSQRLLLWQVARASAKFGLDTTSNRRGLFGGKSKKRRSETLTDQEKIGQDFVYSMDKQQQQQRLSLTSLSSSTTGYCSARNSCLETGDGNFPQNGHFEGQKRMEMSTNFSHLDRIAVELLDTERQYIDDLDDVIQGYLNCLLRDRDIFGVTTVDICELFGPIESVFKMNRQLYLHLNAAQLCTVQMARVFIDFRDRFSCYADYCVHYHRMVATLSRLRDDPQIAACLTKSQTSLGHSLPLDSYLLKPVQRVLKYHLFLENIVKHLQEEKGDDNDKDVILARQALECMTKKAKDINDVRRREEHAIRVVQLQHQLDKGDFEQNQDLSQYGELVLEGRFKLAGTKSERQLFLFDEMLLIVKEKSDKSLVCKDYIITSNLMLTLFPMDPLTFQVFPFDNPRRQYTFLAINVDQKQKWLFELKRRMIENHALNVPEKAKNLVLAVESEINDTGQSHQTTSKVTKYLEKRRKNAEYSRQRSRSATRHIKSESPVRHLSLIEGNNRISHSKLPTTLHDLEEFEIVYPKNPEYFVKIRQRKKRQSRLISVESGHSIFEAKENQKKSEVHRFSAIPIDGKFECPPKEKWFFSGSSERLNTGETLGGTCEHNNESSTSSGLGDTFPNYGSCESSWNIPLIPLNYNPTTIREFVKNWKNRRNDCCKSKGEELDPNLGIVQAMVRQFELTPRMNSFETPVKIDSKSFVGIYETRL